MISTPAQGLVKGDASRGHHLNIDCGPHAVQAPVSQAILYSRGAFIGRVPFAFNRLLFREEWLENGEAGSMGAVGRDVDEMAWSVAAQYDVSLGGQ